MSVDINELKNHSFFSILVNQKSEHCLKDFSDFSDLAATCEDEDLEFANPLDFQQRATGLKCLYLVVNGHYTIHFPTKRAVKVLHDGKKQYFFGFRSRRHEIFGEFYLAKEHAFPNVVATCMSNFGKVISIPITNFISFLDKHPILWKKIFETEVEKLLSLRRYAESIQLESRLSYACVASSILAIADDLDLLNEKEVKFRVFREDFLAYISESTSYNVLSKKIDPLEAENIIEINFFSFKKSGNRFEISKIDKDNLKEKKRREHGRIIWEIAIKDRKKLEDYSMIATKELNTSL
jgi:hypothetical protein